MDLNKKWFLDINSLAGHNPILDTLMINSAKFIPFVLIGLIVYLWFSKRKNEALFTIYSAFLAILISKTIKIIYFHPRPFVTHIGTLLIHHKPTSSFPSNHATFTFAIAFMLLMFKSTRVIGIVAFILAFICAISRVYVGVHWPFDIVGGFFVGLISTILILFLREKLQSLNNLIINLWNRLIYSIFKR